MKEFEIRENDANQRVDKFVAKSVPLLPKSLLYKYIRLKRIKLNGKRCEISTRLKTGDKLSMYVNDEFFEADRKNEFFSAPNAVDIIYEDENLLLADKPVGLCVHESDEILPDTLINRVLHYLYDKGEYDPEKEQSFTPALCNRIDRNTCGIVIAAKNAAALREMNQKIKDREIEKTYLCAVMGIPSPKSGILKNFLLKNETENIVKVFDSPRQGAKTAVTEYKLLKTANGISLVEISLKTGRTHQIRAQMAHFGYPLIGDGKYGSYTVIDGKKYKYQALCSNKLKFTFKNSAGVLGYLNGREFQTDGAWFLGLFD